MSDTASDTAPARGRKFILDTESLRTFREVVAQGGFSAAARVLGITQPAVSLKIRRLEERLGMSLIRRDGHSLNLTDHGRDLLAHAEFIVEAHDRAVDDMQRSELSGVICLGCNVDLAPSGMAEVAARFMRTHPETELAIYAQGSEALGEMLDNGEIDLALMQLVAVDGNVRPTDELGRREDLHVVQGLAADFTDADPVPLISCGPHGLYDPYLAALLDAAARRYRVTLRWADVRGVQRAIESGLGVGILNTSNVTERMRPWTGIDPMSLPSTVTALRSRDGAGEDALVNALKGRLLEALAPEDLPDQD